MKGDWSNTVGTVPPPRENPDDMLIDIEFDVMPEPEAMITAVHTAHGEMLIAGRPRW